MLLSINFNNVVVYSFLKIWESVGEVRRGSLWRGSGTRVIWRRGRERSKKKKIRERMRGVIVLEGGRLTMFNQVQGKPESETPANGG